VIDAKLRYPNSALLGISGDAAQFSNIPSRAYDLWGRIIQVPSNYDPLARTYSGVWDGSFKPAWTDNPAWIYYDLATHPRYGLGHLVTAAQVNKWELYRIAQYCDQPVSDGKGGTEPRFTCNVFLQTASDAYKLLSDLASVFRGISYWTGGAITASADMPADPVYAYTAANVVGGQFTYAASTRKTRYTTALVTWNDPADFYRAKVEYVEDRAGLARYGIQQATLTAFGCTSQAQAQRAGQWVLLTSRLETDTVTFKVGLDGTVAAPGQIIRVTDPARAGKRQGGRIHAATRTTVTVDKAPEQVAVGDRLTVMLPTGASETQTITAVDGAQLSVAAPGFSVQPDAESVWVVESDTLAAQTYRVLSVTEDKSSSEISFTITALQHVPGKFEAIDNGAIIQVPPISALPASTQVAPANVRLEGHVVVTQGIATNVATIAWDAAAGATGYQVEWRRNDGEWVSAGRTSGLSIDVEGIYTGTYVARVRAVSPGGVVSVPAMSVPTDIAGKTGAPPVVATMKATPKVWGIHLEWTFPAGTDDTQRTEVWRSKTPNLQDATKMADLAYPQNSLEIDGLAAGASFYFWVRLVDKTGNVGAFYPNGEGLPGQASSDAGDYEPVITGLIEQTQLGQEILQGVDLANPEMAGTATEWAGDNTHYAGVWTLLDAVQDGDRSIATRVDSVQAKMDGATAAVQQTSQALADLNQSMAKRVDTVQAMVDTTAAALQQTSQAVVDLNGRVSATWTVKCQVNADGKAYAAGLGLGVEQVPDGSYQSQMLFQADRFALLNVSNGKTSTPFVIDSGQTFIDDAFIRAGSITSAKIADASITSAKIGNTQVDTLQIKDFAVTVPKFGESMGYQPAGDLASAVLPIELPPGYDHPDIQVVVTAVVSFKGTFSPGDFCRAELYVNGQLNEGYGVNGNVPPQITISKGLLLPPGIHTLTIRGMSSSSSATYRGTIIAIGAKR
jgi:predicted phage tail protein